MCHHYPEDAPEWVAETETAEEEEPPAVAPGDD
jgi:hypothetical protein